MKKLKKLLSADRWKAAKMALLSDFVFIADFNTMMSWYKGNTGDIFARYVSRMASKHYIMAKKQQEKNRRKK